MNHSSEFGKADILSVSQSSEHISNNVTICCGEGPTLETSAAFPNSQRTVVYLRSL